ncbi:MAG: hypothetical protein AAFQ51_08945 [Pseudomonadota bacterium]
MNVQTPIGASDERLAEPLIGSALTAILPQRFPYLMLDRIDAYEPWTHAHGVKCIAADEPNLLRQSDTHWPMPFVIESLGQLAIGLINLSHGGETAAKVLLGNVSDVTFYDPAPLGSKLDLQIQIDRVIDDQFIASGRADADGRPVMTMGSIICKFILGDESDEN